MRGKIEGYHRVTGGEEREREGETEKGQKDMVTSVAETTLRDTDRNATFNFHLRAYDRSLRHVQHAGLKQSESGKVDAQDVR